MTDAAMIAFHMCFKLQFHRSNGQAQAGAASTSKRTQLESRAMATYPALTLGPLPVDRINRTIGTSLLPGKVTVSKAAHAHIATDHPDEYPAIMAALANIVTAASFIGQDPKHPHAFYLVEPCTSPLGTHALVAIGFRVSPGGTYQVKSAYALKASQFAGRIQAGRLQPLL